MVLAEAVATKTALSIADALIDKLNSKVLKIVGDKYDDYYHKLFNSFKKYIEASQKRHSYIVSLSLPNGQHLLKDFYIPLTLVKNISGVVTKTRVSSFPLGLIDEHKDLLVVDTAGMGKSTLLKYLFINATQLDNKIPIFIELRRLSKSHTIIDHIFHQLQTIDGGVDKELVIRLLQSGDFLILLDGYDEIEDNDVESVTNDILDFKEKANSNNFILSSRSQFGLTSFPDFQRVTIQPLTFEEACQLLRAYSRREELSNDLIAKLKLPNNKSVHEFLGNPLLVSLLFKAYEYKQTIPLKKHLFYRQVYDALFENHDLSKASYERSKKSGLDSYSFLKMVSSLGFITIQTGKIEYSKQEIIESIESVKKLNIEVESKPDSILADLTTSVPLFTVEGSNYRWNHKSLQEYFAASHLAGCSPEMKEKVLTMICRGQNASSYSNFLTLYSDLDPAGFRRYFLRRILNEILSFIEKKRNPSFDVLPENIANQYFNHTFLQHFYVVRFNPKSEVTEFQDNTLRKYHKQGAAAFKKDDADFSYHNSELPHLEKGTIVVYKPALFELIINLIKQNVIPENLFPRNGSEASNFNEAIDQLFSLLPIGEYVAGKDESCLLYQPNIIDSFVKSVLGSSICSNFAFNSVEAKKEILKINEEEKQESEQNLSFG